MFTKKETATVEQRIEILNWYHENGQNQSATARHFNSKYPNLQIKQPLISAWVKDESKWRQIWSQASGAHGRLVKHQQPVEYPEIAEMLDLWIAKAMEEGILISGEVLRQKWTTFADLACIPKDA